jgi:hypothetical protein
VLSLLTTSAGNACDSNSNHCCGAIHGGAQSMTKPMKVRALLLGHSLKVDNLPFLEAKPEGEPPTVIDVVILRCAQPRCVYWEPQL